MNIYPPRENRRSTAAFSFQVSVQLQINIADIWVGYQLRTTDRLKDQPGMHPLRQLHQA